MKVDELIEELEQVKQKHGNLEVRKKEIARGRESFRQFETYVAQNKKLTMIEDREIDDKEKFLAF